MAYVKQTWANGDIITADKLNHMENGIEDNAPTDAQVATAVSTWLNENVDPVGSAVTVDSTLSIAGSAGDAKKTGELIAPQFSTTATYAIGDYCIHEGTLYRFINPHTGAWSASDVVSVNVGGEVSEIKTALNTGIMSIDLDLYQSPSTRFMSRKLSKSEDIYPIKFSCSNSSYSYYIAFYDANNTVLSTTTWKTGVFVLYETDFPTNAVSLAMTCKANDEHALSDAEKQYFSAEYSTRMYNSFEQLEQKHNTYYVATNGDDSNDGLTANTPLKTITKALTFNPTKILVKKGTYSERLNLSDVHGLTIAPYSYGTYSSADFNDKITLDGINARPYLLTMSNCSDVSIIGFKAVNFLNSGFKLTDCTNIKMINCESGNQYGTYEYGIGFELINTDAEMVYCYAHDVTLDGFNIHGYGVTRFVQCTATNCGDDGISHHDACVGYIYGGEYSNCGKGGVASPTYGAYVNIDSVYCHDNLYGIYIVSNSGNRISKAIVSNCASKDNTNKDVYIDYANVTGWNNLYSTKTVGSSATFTEIS